jgi:hypothetical protein
MPSVTTANKGVEVLLQLDIKIDEMIEKANSAIQSVQTREDINESSEEVLRLKSYVESLKEIRADLETKREIYTKRLNSSNENRSMLINEMRDEIFTNIGEIRSIVQEFRTTLSPLLSEEEKEEIRNQIQQAVREYKESQRSRIERIQKRIETHKKRSILEKAREFENSTGIKGVSSHAQSLANGEITIDEFRDRVREFAQEKSSQNIKEKIQDRKNRREERLEERKQLIQERIEQRRERREERIQNRIKNVREQAQERREEIQERVQQRIGNVTREDIENLTTDEIIEKINNLSDEEKSRISQEIGLNISTIPETTLRQIISNIDREQIMNYIEQAQGDVPVEMTQQGRVQGGE